MRAFQSLTQTKALSATAVRFQKIYNLENGKAVFLLAQSLRRFEEGVRFGPRTGTDSQITPAGWLAQHIYNVACQAHCESSVRPILIEIPVSALLDDNICMACHAAIEATPLCPQEISLDISDSSVSLLGTGLNRTLEKLRRLGFRLSLNASRTWAAPLTSPLRLLFEAMRIDAHQFEQAADLQQRVDTAYASGFAIIAEQAHWRDGAYLARQGIQYALKPNCDA